MAVISVEPAPPGGRSGNQGADWRRAYTRAWVVITDDVNDGPKTVREALPVALGMSYYVSETEKDLGAFVNNIRVDEDSRAEDGYQWIATVEYGPYQPLEHPQSPLDEQPRISWSWAQFERIAERDVDDEAIVNAANDAYDPPPMRDDSRPVLQLVRNEANFDQTLADQYRDKVNSTSFFGADPGVVKVQNISANRVLHPDIGYYWEVSYEFHFKSEGWHFFILEQGMNKIVYDPGIIGDVGAKEKMKDRKGSELSAPALLDDLGQQLATGGTPVFSEWIVYEEVDFSVFGFDGFYAELTGA